MKTKHLLLFCFLIITITACSTFSKNSGAESSPYPGSNVQFNTPTSSEGYPYPYPIVEAQMPAEGYPYPNSAYPKPELMATSGPVPQPSNDSGVITGILMLKGEPVVNVSVFLAELLKDEQGNEAIASFARTESPRAFTDTEGKFVFANIKPGKYGLVLDIVLNSFLLNHPNGSGLIYLNVEPGKETKLGKLDYSELPIP